MISNDQNAGPRTTRPLIEQAAAILSQTLKYKVFIVWGDRAWDLIHVESASLGFQICPFWFEMHDETGENVGISTYQPQENGEIDDYTAIYGGTWNFDTPAELAALIASHVIERFSAATA
jgi:hypothetical protein